MNISNILSRAWQIIWKHKILWLFGVLASCGQGGGSSGGSSYNAGSGGSSSFQLPTATLTDTGNMEWAWIMLLVVAGVIFVAFMIFVVMALNTVGRVGVVRGTLQAEEGKEKLTFAELLSGVKPFFWRVLGLNLLIGVSVFAAIFLGIIAFIVIAIVTLGIGLLLLIPLALLFIPLMWAVVVLQEQANVALIVEDISIMDAIRRSWKVVIAQPGNYLVMGLILILGLGLLGLLIVGLPLFFVFIPAIIGLIVNQQTTINAGLVMSGLCFAAYLPFLLVLVGILRSYTITSWTLSYLRWSGPRLPKPVVPPSGKQVAELPEKPADTSSTEPIPDPLTGS